MNITITGNLGSGKTSVCKELEKMGFEIISTGTIFREIAEEKGVSVIELNEIAKTDKSIDDMIDNRTTELGKKRDNVVFDSRLAWNFVPDSFKVFLLVETDEAARRVFEGEARNAEDYTDIEQTKKGLSVRAELEKKRFKELYGIDYFDAQNYNLVIESTNAAPEQIAEEIIRNFELYKKAPFTTKVELNLKEMYPTQSCDMLSMEDFEKCCCREAKKTGCCASESATIMIQNGYIYIIDGHEQIFAAIKEGRVFSEIRSLEMESGKQFTARTEELEAFEKLSDFKYKNYPEQVTVKSGYNIDFSKVFSL